MARDRTREPVIVLAPDSFKESLTAAEVCAAMALGFRRHLPAAILDEVPMADGGEGTAAALVAATGGAMRTVTATGPLGDPVRAAYGLLGDGSRAVVETAAASGLELIPPARRNPLAASSRGTGEVISRALDEGVRQLIVGLGGSATNDGGAGMLSALGARLLAADGSSLPPGASHLARLSRIDLSGLDPRLRETRIRVACDVTNPLLGPHGASAIYGPQKGAGPQEIAALDGALGVLARVTADLLGEDVSEVPGAGAAGGLGFALRAFLGAELESGVGIVISESKLAQRVADADLVVTGEGRLDGQTVTGKTPAGVARVARHAGVPVVAVAGSLGEGADDLQDLFTAVLPIAPGPAPLGELLAGAGQNITRTCAQIAALWHLGSGLR